MSNIPVQVFTLSRFRVLREGVPLEFPAKAQRKPLDLLKLLVALGGEHVPVDQIADALWPDSDGESARGSLASALHRLRKLIGTDVLILSDNRLTLARASCEVDVFAFEAALEAVEASIAKPDAEGAWNASQRALAVYRGPFLDGEFGAPELLTARSRLHSMFIRQVGETAQWFETAGAADRAISLLRRGLEVDGASEELAQRLMRLYAAQGFTTEALALHHRLATALCHAADASVSAETESLRRSIEAAASKKPDPPILNSAPPHDPPITQPAPDSGSPRNSSQWWRMRKVIPAAALLSGLLIGGAAISLHTDLIESDSAGSLAERPSIAVLPFANLSGDPEQEYFADGITDDIITDLSGVRGLLVIARESTFRYKGQPLDIRQVGRDLNVRYVLEGSVRRADGQVRISAQLIDAKEGVHVWADRFDRPIADVFAVQDEITSTIVEELEVSLVEGEQNRILRISTSSPEAYDFALKGRNLFLNVSRENNGLATSLFERATQLDPNYVGALVFLGWAYFMDAQYGWEDVRPIAASLTLMEKTTERILRLDPESSEAQSLLGGMAILRGRHDEGIRHGERAAALNSNSAKAQALLGWMLYTGGRPTEGLRRMKSAMRLNPIPPAWMWSCLAEAHLALRDYESAMEPAARAAASASDFVEPRVFSLVALVRSKRLSEARTMADEILGIDPTFDPVKFVDTGYKYKDASIPKDWIDAMREAGLR